MGQCTIKDSKPIILSAGSQRLGIHRLQKMVTQKQKQASQENHAQAEEQDETANEEGVYNLRI